MNLKVKHKDNKHNPTIILKNQTVIKIRVRMIWTALITMKTKINNN